MLGSNCFGWWLLLLLSLLHVSEQLKPHDRVGAFIGYHEEASAAQGMPNILVINSTYGQIRVKLQPELSPKVVNLVKQLAVRGVCRACTFYRHEPAPENFGKDEFFGPPYALLQGSLAEMADMPPFEGSPTVRKGDACIIPNTKEFFIATADHPEWGNAHTVWGQVADESSWSAINSMPYEPYTTRTEGTITTRWLTPNATVPFNLLLENQNNGDKQPQPS